MLEYNTTRNKLIIREYGRNIQKMIEDVVKIEDRAQRTEAAKAIVKTMSFVNPAVSANGATGNNNAQPDVKKQREKESVDYWHKLWDHLFIISNYELDVDAPFPKPAPIAEDRHQAIACEYKKKNIRIRTYGRYMENIIKTVAEYPEGAEKVQLTCDIANQMKKLYLTWNRDTVDDALIINQLEEISDGKLKLPEGFEFSVTRENLPKNNVTTKPTKKKKKKKKKKNSTESGVIII